MCIRDSRRAEQGEGELPEHPLRGGHASAQRRGGELQEPLRLHGGGLGGGELALGRKPVQLPSCVVKAAYGVQADVAQGQVRGGAALGGVQVRVGALQLRAAECPCRTRQQRGGLLIRLCQALELRGGEL